MIGIGLIGYGHWGPNHARIFRDNPIVESSPLRMAANPGERLPGRRYLGPARWRTSAICYRTRKWTPS